MKNPVKRLIGTIMVALVSLVVYTGERLWNNGMVVRVQGGKTG